MQKPTYPELYNPKLRQLVYRRALQLYGKDNQLIVATEEMSELIKEISKMVRGIGDQSNLIEEIADVRIMVEQLEMIFDVHDEAEKRIVEKLERLTRRMDKDEMNIRKCDSCRFRDRCVFPKLHPGINLKDCEDYEEDEDGEE